MAKPRRPEVAAPTGRLHRSDRANSPPNRRLFDPTADRPRIELPDGLGVGLFRSWSLLRDVGLGGETAISPPLVEHKSCPPVCPILNMMPKNYQGGTALRSRSTRTPASTVRWQAMENQHGSEEHRSEEDGRDVQSRAARQACCRSRGSAPPRQRAPCEARNGTYRHLSGI